MKKRLYWVFATLLGFVLVLITTVIVLLGTETGLRWALRQTAQIAPELLEIGALEGHLLDRLQVQKMQLNLPTMRLRVDELVLEWQPSALLRREFHLSLLKIDAVTIEAVDLAQEPPETTQDQPPYPIALPDVKLPLTVIIDAVQINGVEIVNNPVRIETIALQARWDDKGIAIQQFDVAMPELQFAADGRIDPVGDYPLEIQTLLSLSHASMPNGQLQGTIAGNKRQIDITQRFDGDAQIDLGAAITQPLENLAWDEVVFQASEYVKDGLIAIVEATGKGPWYQRMKAIEEDKGKRTLQLVESAHPDLGKLGVFWHTQGSGKSYSMAFFAEKVRRIVPGNFTFVLMTDRNDLDSQIYKTFVGCGVADEQTPRAGSGKELEQLLKENHRYVFSLIHKCNQDVNPEEPYSERDDIIVISDEAHRTQAGRRPSSCVVGLAAGPIRTRPRSNRRGRRSSRWCRPRGRPASPACGRWRPSDRCSASSPRPPRRRW